MRAGRMAAGQMIGRLGDFARHGCCLLAMLAFLAPASGGAGSPATASKPNAAVPPNLAAAMATYRHDLEIYLQAQASYTAAVSAYWNSIAEKRRLRNAKRSRGEPLAIEDYVLVQPPVYTGPPRPRDPSKPNEEAPPPRIPYVPVVADYLAASQREYKFVPRMPQSESQYKLAYASVARAAGLTRD